MDLANNQRGLATAIELSKDNKLIFLKSTTYMLKIMKIRNIYVENNEFKA